MFPNIKRVNFSHHIYTEMNVPLLKQAVIYGANGSGKSNFIKAIDFLCSFVIYEDFIKKIDLDDYFFQLAKEKLQNISFEIEFFHKDEYYIYNADISKKEIREKLSKSNLGKTEDSLIFERRGTDITAPSTQNKTTVKQLLSRSSDSSLLSLNHRFPVLSSKGANHIYDWFSKKIEVISIGSAIPALINVMSQKPEMLSFANKVFENIGIGIKAVGISDTPFEKWIAKSKNATELQDIIDENSSASNGNISQIKNNRNVLNIAVQKGTKTVQEFLFDQLGQSGYHRQMKITAQSDGTVRLLFLIPALYAAIHQGKTVFIDEIDNSIHPNLMFELLRFYANTKSTGQLIFTTHTTKFLNQQELLRPDEIWFTEKLDGNTRMYSLNDFKLHNTLNIENGYLDGRYGGAPVMDEIIPEI
jgi:AAA15 family ATPase/GTPase